jgi:hypothetical protein
MAYSRPQNRPRVSESIVLTYGKWSRISPPISGPPAKNQKTVFIANLDVNSSTVLVLISVLDLRRFSTTERPLSHSVTGWAEFRGDIAPHRSESVHFSQVYDIKFSRLFVPEIAYSGSKNREEPVPCIRINRLDLWEGPWVILRRVESRFGVISLLRGPKRWLLCHFSSTHSCHVRIHRVRRKHRTDAKLGVCLKGGGVQQANEMGFRSLPARKSLTCK